MLVREERVVVAIAAREVAYRVDGRVFVVRLRLRDLNAEMDKKFDIVFSKLDEMKDLDNTEHRDLSNRLTIVESEKGLVSKILTVAIGAVSGLGGAWWGRHP